MAARHTHCPAKHGTAEQTLYRPGSATWRVNRETLLLLGGGRALLMQLAHPGVAAGVDEHSDFRKHRVNRLLRTLALTWALSFGTRDEARAAARAINQVHRRVSGRGYSARQPKLLLWVHATLVDSALVTYQTFIRPLAQSEREAYHEEAKLAGRLLGIPAAAFPPDLAAFDDYVAAMVAGGLEVDARARRLAAEVLVPGSRQLTAGLLPAALRDAYKLPWGRREQLLFTALRTAIPRLLPLLPGGLRFVPRSRIAADSR